MNFYFCARNFKSASRFALVRFWNHLLARLLPELYSTRSNYYLILSAGSVAGRLAFASCEHALFSKIKLKINKLY